MKNTIVITIHCEIVAEVMSDISDDYCPGVRNIDPLSTAPTDVEADEALVVLTGNLLPA